MPRFLTVRTPCISARFMYPVIFTREALAPENPAIETAMARPDAAGPAPVVTFVDDGVWAAWPDWASQWVRRLERRPDRFGPVAAPRRVPGGEALKNATDTVLGFARDLLRPGLDRHALVVAVGGGAVLDAVGFAASLVHRGLRVVRFPTTVLAQNDAGIGVKTGINIGGVKNAWGTFQAPHGVVADLDFLDTLEDRDWRGGLAEAWKVALLKDAALFEALCRDAAALGARERAPMASAVIRGAELHLAHLAKGGDPFELGSSRPLDFGHWAAHGLESLSSFRIGHGEAVAVGIALDTAYAVLRGWVPASVFDRLRGGLAAMGLPTWYPEMDRADGDGEPMIFQAIDAFREHLGGALLLAFPDGLGRMREERAVDRSVMREALARLRPADRAGRGATGSGSGG